MLAALRLLLLPLLLCLPALGIAQDYPNRPIKLVNPFPAGNSSDVSMRLIAQHLGPLLGQPVVVENRAGAGGTIGTEFASRQPPDGYTLVMGSPGPLTIAPVLQTKLAYKPLADFVPIAAIAGVPQVFVVNAASPIKDIPALIEAARQKPGSIFFGSSGSGSTQHLMVSRFGTVTETQLVHVPYKGGSDAMADLLGGRIGLLSDAVSVVLPHLKSGKARALGVTSRTRVPALPEVATIEEQGLRGYALESWILLLAPAGTPEPILARLSNEVRQILARPEVKQSLVDQGFTELSVPRESLPEFVKMQAGIWARLVAESGAKID